MAFNVTEVQKDALYRNGYYENNLDGLQQEDIEKFIEVEKLINLTTIKKILKFFCFLAIIGIIAGIVVIVKLAAISKGIY